MVLFQILHGGNYSYHEEGVHVTSKQILQQKTLPNFNQNQTCELLHFPLILMNRLNKTESAVSYTVGSLYF